MHTSIKWHGQQFNVNLHGSSDRPPFLEVKGCRIANGKNGEFVSWPSTKKDDGKYWNHAYASEAFNEHVLKLAKAAMPAQEAPKPKHQSDGGIGDMDDDIPF